jgi:ABC-type nitrate/sulfonate/bicarbonate transport system substrate-binding protein
MQVKKWIWPILLIYLSVNQCTVFAKEKVSLQLRWDHQFQFAGYYAAKWQGFYEQAGLEVEIRSALQGQEIVKAVEEVESGRADFGIGAADILKACDNGAELVVVTSIFQHSGAAFYAREDSSLEVPSDFLKMKVARRIDDLLDVEFQVLMKAEGIDPQKISAYPHQPGIDHLISREVDLIPGYIINIPYVAKTSGYALKELKPLTYGIDFYGDSIFTSAEMARRNPDLVKRFRNMLFKTRKKSLPEFLRICPELILFKT